MATAVIFDATGDPSELRLVEFVPPVPRPGEVLVELRAIGVNRSDAAFRSGKYLIPANPPSGLGIEGAGIVLAVGDGVEAPVGQRVSILPIFPQGGRYATYASSGVFPSESLVAVPEGLDDLQAAALWVSYLTAWGALVERGALRCGEYVLISAASSSVGLAAIQICNRIGAVSIATTRTSAKADALREAGAAHVIASEEQDLAPAIHAITCGSGLRIAFDAIAGPFAEALVPCMAEEGIIFFYGGLSDQPTAFDRRAVIGKGISFTGFAVAQILKRADRWERAREFILGGLADGDLRPHIDRCFPLDQAVEAHRYVESGGQFGKILLIP